MLLSNEHTLLAIPLLPLIGFALSFIIGQKSGKQLSGIIATSCVLLSFLLSCSLFAALLTENSKLQNRLAEIPEFTNKLNLAFSVLLGDWFVVGAVRTSFELLFDNLSAVMTLVITGVGCLIHVYSIGYMKADAGRPRFFAYLNLFVFFMLLLVLSNNLLLLFVGWEGVGLCSYLLIGFWFKDPNNAKAGQKAFIVNRIGDAAFLLGIFLIVTQVGVLDFASIAESVQVINPRLIEIIALFLLIGAIGKSAQMPLHIWLPDAMAGPTPVSALIHAATMVTAGVYLIARMSFLYVLAPQVELLIAVLGTLTALFAATIALTQNDIKKVLAYSTISQLGFMFMALGVGAFSVAIYHVVTHAFGKACLFLSAGSVICACRHEQDMRKLDCGLWKKMPETFVAYLMAALAIAGFPLTAGFFSKDAILWSVFSSKTLVSEFLIFDVLLTKILFGVALFTAFLTAVYLLRSVVLIFGKPDAGAKVQLATISPATDSSEFSVVRWSRTANLTMLVPILVLGFLSLGFGLVAGSWLMEFLQAENLAIEKSFEILSSTVAVVGIALTAVVYFYYRSWVEQLLNIKLFSRAHKILLNKWYVDELYDLVIVRPLSLLSNICKFIDKFVIDGLIQLGAALVNLAGETLRELQTGKISFYLVSLFVANLTLLVLIFILKLP
ncbi:MAG: NADH-quinone oxidoreductase subunit L [Deltaproteobacteria bacterium]|jgi:NADH-quinone oxidoreductase subunit L|nr:NADH-quinone oxidoreductase subunit L [Deltaproteobacteria bacterium]